MTSIRHMRPQQTGKTFGRGVGKLIDSRWHTWLYFGGGLFMFSSLLLKHHILIIYLFIYLLGLALGLEWLEEEENLKSNNCYKEHIFICPRMRRWGCFEKKKNKTQKKQNTSSSNSYYKFVILPQGSFNTHIRHCRKAIQCY